MLRPEIISIDDVPTTDVHILNHDLPAAADDAESSTNPGGRQ